MCLKETKKRISLKTPVLVMLLCLFSIAHWNQLHLSVCSPKKSFRDSETMSRELSLTGLLLIGVWVLLDVLIFRWCAHFYCFESNCTVWTQEDRKKINVFIVIWMSRWEDRFLWPPYTARSRWWRHTTALAKQRAFHCSVGCLSATLKMLEK